MGSAAKAAFIALFVGAATLSSGFVAAGLVRRAAHRDSHERPVEEHWIEPETLSSPALIANGRKLFLNSCAHCHGADARGDEGPDLHAVKVSDRYIGNIITHGIPHEMPSFAKKLSPDDITALLAYVRSLD
jgi:mono/diheme cytochrome c family protein